MKKKITIGINEIVYYEYGINNKESIVFLHGFSYPPKHYSFLKKLGEKFHVIAPLMYGINYLKEQPKNLEEYASLTKKLLFELNVKPIYLVGHSMGGAVSYMISEDYTLKKLVLINPVLENNHGVWKFLGKSMHKNRRNLSKKVKKEIILDYKVFFKYLINYSLLVLKKPFTTIKLIKSISKFSYNKSFSQKTVLFYGSEDEFFDLEKQKLKKIKNLKLELLEGYNHDWPLLAPKKAYEEILKSITSQKLFK